MNKESSLEKCVLIPFIKYQRLMKQQQQIGAGGTDNFPYKNENKAKTDISNKVHIIPPPPPPPGKTDIISSQDKSEISSWVDNWESVIFKK